MSTAPRPALPVAGSYFSYLQQYRHDRGALASLRGAVSEARRPGAWPLLAGFPGAIGSGPFEIAAALWANDPDLDTSTGDLGNTMAALKAENKSFEGRFKRLLTCDREEIGARVAPMVRAAQAKGMRMNYAQLLSDLLCWGDEVKVRWAKAFWSAVELEGENQTTVADASEVRA